jgi:FkbM family methyltransferase
MLDFTRKVFRHSAGFSSGLRFLKEVRGRGPGGGQEVVIPWKHGSGQVTLLPRSGTTDISTAAEVFCRGLYRLPDGWQPRVILDVGGNAGMVTLYYAALYPNAVVHSFEPVPANAARIRRHVEANGLKNVTVHEFGLSGRDATVELAASGEGAHWDYCEGRQGGGPAVTVQMRHAGAVFQELGLTEIDLMKFDIEGGESQFLPAIAEHLSGIRWIIGELHGASGDWLPCLDLISRSHTIDYGKDFGAAAFTFCAVKDAADLAPWSAMLARNNK